MAENIFQCGAVRQAISAWVRVTGEDAGSFLQGQFSQDLRVKIENSQVYGLWLNQKGKMVGDSHVLVAGENEFFLWSEATPEAVLVERLESYIIADDVLLQSLAAKWVRTMIVGAGASAWIEAKLGVLPDSGCFGRCGESWVLRGRQGALDAWEWLSPAGMEPDVSDIQSLDTTDLARARVRAGLALVPVEVGPGDLPHEAGLDEVGVAYNKGCYLGQEVMARLKSMGRVRRRLMRVAGPSAVLVPGCPCGLWQGGKQVGELRLVIPPGGSDGGAVGLAMLNLFSLNAAGGLALSADGPCDWRVEEQA